jgi:hypothetical protein
VGLFEESPHYPTTVLQLLGLNSIATAHLPPLALIVKKIFTPYHLFDHLCSLVVRVPGYRSRGPGSIPGTTRIPEK